MTDEDSLIAAIRDAPMEFHRWASYASWLWEVDRCEESLFLTDNAELICHGMMTGRKPGEVASDIAWERFIKPCLLLTQTFYRRLEPLIPLE